MMELDRRTLLALGMGTLVLGASGCSPTAVPTVPAPQTYAEWVARRKAPYFIAHRGAGTTIPEHSLPGYRTAVDWGAEALELSVVISSDGELFCHHDLTLDRTTTLTGKTADTTSETFAKGRIRVPRLGPRWNGDAMPAIPRLSEALDVVGRRILCIEAKDDAAYDPMMRLLDERGLLAQVMVKVGYGSARIAKAKAAGLPVFAYFGSTEAITRDALEKLRSSLGTTDAIVLPARNSAGAYVDKETVRAATSGDVPVWVYPIHRRMEIGHFSTLGVSGYITPALGYLTNELPTNAEDSFDARQLAPGLTTKDPYSDWHAVGWGTEHAIELIGSGARSVCLGDLSPVAAASGSYRVELQTSLLAGPWSGSDAFYLAFGCPNDAYHQGQTGYELALRMNGEMRLSKAVTTDSRYELGEPIQTPALEPKKWTRIAVEVTPDSVSISRDGGDPITYADQKWRGGYLHVGRSHGTPKLGVREIRVTTR